MRQRRGWQGVMGEAGSCGCGRERWVEQGVVGGRERWVEQGVAGRWVTGSTYSTCSTRSTFSTCCLLTMGRTHVVQDLVQATLQDELNHVALVAPGDRARPGPCARVVVRWSCARSARRNYP